MTQVLRTPEARFAGLPDFPWSPRLVEVGGVRIAYVDEGPKDAAPVLLMHGEPTWSYLYRKVIPGLLAAGHRVLAPDLVGFGRSDKPTDAGAYTYAQHVEWMVGWLDALELEAVTLFAQDWGSLIGLRMVVARPDRFARVAIGNGGLPTGEEATPRAFRLWSAFARYSPWFPISRIVASGCVRALTAEERRAYDAPFPSSAYKVGARVFPKLVPTTPQDPEHQNNLAAWAFFRTWTKPLLTLFSSRDPITRGGHRRFEREIPGAQGQPHQIIRRAGHFLQEDAGPELAAALDAFVKAPSR